MLRRRRRLIWWTLGIALALSAVLLLLFVLDARLDPGTVSQERWYRIGVTCRLKAMRARIPEQRPVVVRRPDDPAAIVLLQVLLPFPLGVAGTEVKRAEYDPMTGRITIIGQLERLEASLPFPWLQSSLRRSLRHEYGHAFLDDWLEAHGIIWRDSRYIALTVEDGRALSSADYPVELRPVIEEFAVQPRLLYGSPELTSTFGEYMAESYARYADRESVPPAMERFLAANCGM